MESQDEYHGLREHSAESASDEQSINGVYMVASGGIKRVSREHKWRFNGASKLYQVAAPMRRGESGGIYQAFYNDIGGITRESF